MDSLINQEKCPESAGIVSDNRLTPEVEATIERTIERLKKNTTSGEFRRESKSVAGTRRPTEGNERLARYSRRIGGDISPRGAQYLLGGGGGPAARLPLA
ncbi:hypothetical protein K0M31_018157 [Melipona bicolor]|uniref:Uncharacterized protein n=1 Tax=Melipona bicolor TaxID=60889 RepID=A0AA40KE38_9HYME|nr:hypothetical protein K0M31_018157 [Melipona bicolor]